MKTKFILLCILFAITANLFTTAKAQVNTTDSLALVDFYNSTNGPNWYYHANWLTTEPVSTWVGITVANNRVTEINLSSNGISGTLPASIGNITNLYSIILYENQISGSIPSSIGNLVNLHELALFTNQLSGTIPAEIGKLGNLYFLELESNQLTGAIPAEIGNLVNLNYLNLRSNQLNGSIPSSIGNLVNLEQILLDHNQLTGKIPFEFGNLVNLGIIYLSYNQLTGQIPASFNKLKLLYEIDINDNFLTQNKDFHFPLYENSTVGGTYITNNLFTFNGLEFIANKFHRIYYAPQNTILPIHQHGNVLSVYAGGTLKYNTYKWFEVGSTINTTVTGDSTFTPLTSGKYYAMVTNFVANQLTLHSDTINFVMPSAQQSSNTLIAEAAQSATITKQMQVFPNPAKDVIHVQINGNAIITLTNSAGKILLSKSINNSGEINVSSYANGVYYIQNKTTGEVQKLIVVH